MPLNAKQQLIPPEPVIYVTWYAPLGAIWSIIAPLPTPEVPMRVRPTLSAAVVFAAVTLAVTAASPRTADAFIFLPIFQNQPITDSRQGRTPTDNRWRDDTAKPVKPSTATKPRDDDGKSSSSSAGKGAKSSTKSEAKTNSGQTSRSRSVKQEPPASKSSSRSSTTAHRTSPSGSSASTAAQEASPSTTSSSASASVQEGSSAGAGSNVGDIFEEKLGEVFKARIDELLKGPASSAISRHNF